MISIKDGEVLSGGTNGAYAPDSGFNGPAQLASCNTGSASVPLREPQVPLLHAPYPVPQAAGLLEFQVAGMLMHLAFEGCDPFVELGRRQAAIFGHLLRHRRELARRHGGPGTGYGALHDIGNALDDAPGGDAMGLVMGHLFLATARGFPHGALHGAGDLVGIENGLAMQVAGGPADGLDQRTVGAQEALLVRIQDGDQGHLGHVQALAQQVDPHQHVELTQAQVTDDLHPLHGVDVGMQVADPHTVLVEVFGQVLGHALGEGGDQHPVALAHPLMDL